MSQVKIPQLNVNLKIADNPKSDDEWSQVNPSCLLAYLGIRGYGSLIGVQTKNVGKNTIGDNNKMSVNLKTYNMSTHDLSTVVRNTQAPGTLVPNLTLLVQKGDIIDIDIEANVLTHPTVGPLFGRLLGSRTHHKYTYV